MLNVRFGFHATRTTALLTLGLLLPPQYVSLQDWLRGSKARHQNVQRHYGVIDEAVALQDLALPNIDPGENAAAYKLRIQPFIEQLVVKAAIAPALKQEADGQRVTALSLGHKLETAKETVQKAEKTLQVLHDLSQYAPAELQETDRRARERRAAAAKKQSKQLAQDGR